MGVTGRSRITAGFSSGAETNYSNIIHVFVSTSPHFDFIHVPMKRNMVEDKKTNYIMRAEMSNG